jgi:2-polyprenyl-6-methoxyphenol hydroxylase-like FAD-dependent oxidoreductase
LYVAGCDGAHSAVREALGFTLEGRTYGIRAALADVHLGDDKPYDFPRFSTQGPFAAGILIEKSLWRLILLYPSSSLLSLDERVKEGVRGLFGQDRYELVWQSEFHLHQRLSSGFVSGRAALAGDAAHLNSPVGGQGMNAGIQDTEVLCKTLLKALDCRDPEELRAYERERRLAVRKGVNRFTNQLTKVLLFRDGRYIKTILGLAGHVLKIPSLRHAFLRRMAMLPRR